MSDASHELPLATLQPRRRWSLAWLVPIAALAFIVFVFVRSYMTAGPTITVQLADGHGLKAGDKIRYRGIVVGEISEITLNERGPGVLAYARLVPEASTIAQAGSRFWVVRPQVGFEGVAGIETIVGPRYLAVLPGEGLSQRNFVGLAEPPAVETIDPDDLEIILLAQQRGSIRKGAPVMYRQMRVGTVISIGLAGDGSAVEARVHIDRAFRQLVRPETRFWDAGGVDAKVRITGVDVRVPSFEALLAGGVAFATPESAGEPVRTGKRFALEPEPDEEWLEWEPAILVGSVHLPPGASLPSPLRAKMAWLEGRFWKGEEMRQGWVLQTERGLLGPAELFVPGQNADRNSVVLEVAGVPLTLEKQPVLTAHGLALLEATVEGPTWPVTRIRRAEAPEECIAVADVTDSPLPLASAKMFDMAGVWQVDPSLSVDASWHGAAIIARADGRLLGIMLVDGQDVARVVLLPDGAF